MIELEKVPEGARVYHMARTVEIPAVARLAVLEIVFSYTVTDASAPVRVVMLALDHGLHDTTVTAIKQIHAGRSVERYEGTQIPGSILNAAISDFAYRLLLPAAHGDGSVTVRIANYGTKTARGTIALRLEGPLACMGITRCALEDAEKTDAEIRRGRP